MVDVRRFAFVALRGFAVPAVLHAQTPAHCGRVAGAGVVRAGDERFHRPAVEPGVTGGSGTFEFIGAKAGQYDFAVHRDGYLALNSGAPGSGELPAQITVSNHVRLGSFVFHLHPAGVNAGRVRCASDAEPAVGAVVELYRERRMRGQHAFEPAGRAIAGDQGSHRIYGLTPGSCYVAAT